MTVTKWTSLVAGGGGIPCEDLISFQARCKTNGGGGHRLQARVTLTDTSHNGEQVTITVDGEAIPVTVEGQRAQLSMNNAEPGSHTLELTDPSDCFSSIVTECD